MNFTYENQGANTFLVYAIEEGEQLDSMSVGMITNNDIPGLVKAVFTQMDTNKYIKYNVSSKIPVKQFFSRPINKSRLLGVLHGIVDAVLSAEEYMIDPNMIIIDTDYIYTDVSRGETTLICLPIIQKEPQIIDLGAFFKRIMFTMQFDQAEDCDYVAKIINYLNKGSIFSLETFKELLTEISAADKSASAVLGSTGHPPVVDDVKNKQPQIQPSSISTTAKSSSDLPNPHAQHSIDSSDSTGQQALSSSHASVQAQDTDKKISLFYLLQHYNKENAAAYKAQKEKKKAQKSGKTRSASVSKKQKIPAYPVPGQAEASGASPMPSAYMVPSAPAAPAEPSALVLQGFSPATAGGQYGQEPNVLGDFGNTVYLNGGQSDASTVILGQERPAQRFMPYLLRRNNGEKIPITKPVFRLGRDAEFNDYAIIDNMHVGHSHCHIVSRDGEYFVVDDNSMNHTFIGDKMIPSGQEVKLTHGCSLTIANEEFEFKLY